MKNQSQCCARRGNKRTAANLADVVEHTAAPEDGFDDRREVVVQNDDVGGLTGDLSSGNTHSKTDVGSAKSGTVVSTVTGDSDLGKVLRGETRWCDPERSYDVAPLLEQGDEAVLVVGL